MGHNVFQQLMSYLTHWGQVTPVCTCVHNLTIIGSDNGLAPSWCQAIIWTNAGILSIGSLGTSFSEILIKMQNFSFTKMHLKILSEKWRPFCPGGDELITPLFLYTHSWCVLIRHISMASWRSKNKKFCVIFICNSSMYMMYKYFFRENVSEDCHLQTIHFVQTWACSVP